MKRKITRELAQRLSGTVEVLLLWQPQTDQVELSVHDLATDAGFHLEVAPAKAMDAFYHPYAYAAMPENSYSVGQDEWMIVNG
jgi:hypothetical protein